MKKTVRIRKALPGEQPGYYNKTAKFLKKAQMGMEVSSVSRDPERMKVIYQNVYNSLRQSTTPDLVYNELVTEYALDQQTSLQIIQAALNRLAEEGYIDPETMNQKQQKQEEEPSAAQDQQQADEEQQRASDDAEQEELAMSDEGYYDEEEAQMNDNSHLETEEDEQQQAFRFGGYRRQEGGESDEYSEYEDLSEDNESEEDAVINQYNNPGQNKMKKPFSLEDLMAVTPGMQGQEAFPDLSYYLGDYRPISDSYTPMEYLPSSKYGGPLPKAQDGLNFLRSLIKPIQGGLNFTRKVSPMTNLSGLRKTVPLFTGIGQAVSKIAPSYFTPKLETTFTQNRDALWSVLNGASPVKGIFSQTGSPHRNATDGSLTVDRLLLYQEDVQKIIENIEKGRSAFQLADIDPKAEYDGLISGVYPMESKIFGGTDDNGFKFFEIKHTFTKNQKLPFGTTPSTAKETTFKNRFYFNREPDGTIKITDPLGKPLSTGIKTKYKIRRPLGTTLSRIPSSYLTDAASPLDLETSNYENTLTGYEYGYPSKSSASGTIREFEETTPIYDEEGNLINNEITTSYMDVDREPQFRTQGTFGTPYPHYMEGFFGTGPLGRLSEVSDTPPATWDRLGRWGKAKRLGEYFLYSGLNHPFRTPKKNVYEMSLPVYGYVNSSLGPGIIDPAKEGSYGPDLKRAMNYKYRLGLKAGLGLGAGTYLGYKTWDAIANPCQCEHPLEKNYMPKDVFGKCPCGTEVGPIRTLDPTGIPIEEDEFVQPKGIPDSMLFLINQGKEPNAENYWKFRPRKNKDNFSDDFAKGGITKNQFIKKFTKQFQEGGDQQNGILGKGNRTDTLTNDVSNKKDIFKTKLKNNSNVALTEEIYKNAQSNPQILNILLQGGKKNNLAEDSEMQTAQYGGYSEDTIPNWYTGYRGMITPREYRKLFKQMKRMTPDGLDISRANMASNFYDKRNMNAPFGNVTTYPEYINMMTMSQIPLIGSDAFVQNSLGSWGNAIDRNTPVYGMPGSSENQAEDAITKNNLKGGEFLPELYPDFVDSPLVGNPQDVEDYWRNKRAPIVGETWDTWYTSDGSTPGFAPDTRTWDGTQWVGPSPSERMQLENREQGGFVDTDAEEPLFKFIYGGDEAEYYEPYELPMADEGGITIKNKAGQIRGVADPLNFEQWAEGEKEDWLNANPGGDFEAWKTSQASKDGFLKYKDFYSQALDDYFNYDKPDPNNNTNNNTSNCPEGMAWSNTYKSCIPIATKRYNTRIVRGNPGFFNTVLPWNAPFGYAGSWTKQMSLPYDIRTGQAYNGQLTGAPVARYVTKKGIFGRPKKWIDVYNTGSGGVNLSELEQLMEQNKRRNNKQSNNKQSNNNKNNNEGPREVKFSSAALKYKLNPFKNKGKEKGPREVKFRKLRTWLDNKLYEGYKYDGGSVSLRDDYNLPIASGGINVPSTPMSANATMGNQTGLIGNVIQGPNTTWGAQQYFNQANNPVPTSASVTAYNNNTNNYSNSTNITTEPPPSGRGLETCTEEQKRDTTSQCYCSPEAKANPNDKRCYKSNLIGVKNKRKDMYNIDPEAGLNVFNAGARGVTGFLDRRANRKNESNFILDTVDPFNLYASANEQDRGDWQDFGSKSGMFRYDKEGQDRSSRATYGNFATSKYGGYMQQGGFTNPYFEQDEEVYMTPEELEQFLAAGGQVEYL